MVIPSIKEIEQVFKEYEALKNTRNENTELVKEIIEHVGLIQKELDGINKIISKLDPARSPITSKKRGSYAEATEQATSFVLDAINKGTHITFDLLDKAFPDMYLTSQHPVWKNVLLKLNSMPNVQKAMDGKKIRFYK